MFNTAIIVELFENVFGGITLPVCLAIVDSDGLTLYITEEGTCGDIMIFEAVAGSLISPLSEAQKAIQIYDKSDKLAYLTLGTEKYNFYIDRISDDIFLVVSTKIGKMNEIIPFVNILSERMKAVLSKDLSKE